MAEAVLSLGGNLGDPRATLARAIDLLCDGEAVRLIARSSDWRTPPWGDPDQPAFVNLCLIVETTLAPRELLARARDVETALGRNRSAERRWGPRTVDIDIVTIGDDTSGELIVDEPGLTLPHPRALERAFVLAPLAEIAPQQRVAGMTARDALAHLDVAGVERLP
ncbi:MAG: 2-amino-4-hydroxy-6-hydroxymethyldihydropteridine diphosphokinase [Rhodoplanes sp.]|uniref:2-amino-4-hydroxy-6- hydroxymethyldihydropteridine diphosphokinase n=1 Tax=Rhodoplanes sp. TaxID=1968906 RepID=UPI00183D7006|nr:2-amino-4-hydroxy-6-hydroxymethyldihydropteridine diphosphokinase [Rhodoplanes sp.]NVO14725.1 2-amino-4-hydroxy-6-hydroxymethyldihydropteridine diphosphokinase [Rhodoplanes sp.]